MCNVSVLVPVYNVKKYLSQCLDSLAGQTLADIEFVCIDDGSTAGCNEILDTYAKKDHRFRVIHKANSGYGASMNLGLRQARGKYIGILESDDFTAPETFKTLYDVAEASQAEVVKSNFYMIDEATGERFHELLKGCTYGTICTAQTESHVLQTDTYIWDAIYRKDFLEKYHIRFLETPGASYQDVSFCFKTLSCCRRMMLLRDGFVRYRVDNPSSSIHKSGARKVKFLRKEFEEYWSFLRAQSEKIQQVGYIVAPNMWRMLTGVFGQIPLEEKQPERFYHLRDDFMKLEQEGFLKESYWQTDEWGRWKRLRQHVDEIAQSDDEKTQQWLALREKFLRRMKQSSGVYLYGAGRVASEILKTTERHGVCIDGILVSEAEGNPSTLDGVQVRIIEHTPAERAHDLIIIATTSRKPAIQKEIFHMLQQTGFRNVVVLTEDLQHALSWC